MKNLRQSFFQFIENKDKFYTVADSAVLSIGRLVAGSALAHLAGAEAFAQYLLFITVSVILLNLPTTMHIMPMVNMGTGMKPQARSAMLQWSHNRLIPAFYLGLGLFVLCFPVALILDINAWIYAGFACATLVNLELQYQRACLQTIFRTRTALIADCTAFFTTATIIFSAWAIFNSPVIGFWWGSAAGSTLAILIMRREHEKCAFSSGKVDVEVPSIEIREKAQRDGRAMLGGSIAYSACSRIQPFVLAGVGGTMVVAAFGTSWTLIGPVRMLSAALNGMLRPRLAIHFNRNDSNNFQRVLLIVYLFLAIVGLSGIAVSFVIGPSIVAFVFGESLRHAGLLLPIAITYGTLDAITTSQTIAMQIKLKNGSAQASRLRAGVAVVSVLLMLPACFFFGAWGAFGALLTAELVFSVGAARAIRNVDRRDAEEWMLSPDCQEQT